MLFCYCLKVKSVHALLMNNDVSGIAFDTTAKETCVLSVCR